MVAVVGRAADRHHAVVGAVEGDARHADVRLLCEAGLQGRVRRVAGRQAMAVAVGVDHDVDEIGVVEGRRAALVGRVVELPDRRPHAPQQLAQRAPVLRQAGAAALGVEVILVPVPRLVFRRDGLPRRRDVLDLVAVDRDQARAALGPQRRGHAGRGSAPVVSREHRARDGQRIEQVPHVGADRGLLARSRRARVGELGRAEAAQVGHDDAAALGRELRRHLDVGLHVVGKAVQQQHRRAIGRTAFVEGDLEHAGLHAAQAAQSVFIHRAPRPGSTRRASSGRSPC